MNTYVSDKEQIEMIRNWWRENGKFTVIAIIVTILMSYGWRYWQDMKLQNAANASMLYEQLLSHQSSHQFSDVENDANNLLKKYSNTPYASLAALISAQNAVLENKLEAAAEKLQWTIEHTKNSDFREIAKIRQARVFITLNKLSDALKLVNQVGTAAYFPIASEVKGDILFAQGDKKGAHLAYQNALSTLPKMAANRNFLQLKYDQLNN